MTYFLIYKSSSISDFSQADLVPLLKQARLENSNQNITGILLMKDGEFLQLLEGDEAVVKELFQNIKEDPRHHSVTIINEGTSLNRFFENWSMAFEHLGTQFQSVDPDVDVFVRTPEWKNQVNLSSQPELSPIAHFMNAQF